MKKNETKEREKAITEKEIAEMTTWECLRKCIGWKAAFYPILKPRKSDYMSLVNILLFILQIIPWGIIFSYFYAKDIVKMAKINVSREARKKHEEIKKDVSSLIDSSAPKAKKTSTRKKSTTPNVKKTDGKEGTEKKA